MGVLDGWCRGKIEIPDSAGEHEQRPWGRYSITEKVSTDV